MSAPVNSTRGLDADPLLAVLTPVIDIPFASIASSYTTFQTIVAASAILVLSNYTDQMVDYTLSAGLSTQGHLAAGQVLVLNLKSNKVPGSGSIAIGFKSNTTAPSSGFCSVTNIGIL